MQGSPLQIAAKRTAKQRLWPKLLLSIGAVLATLAGLELFARLLGWGEMVEFVPDEHYGFLMRRSQTVYTYGHPVHINSLGLRGPELRNPKQVDTARIVFIGDSVTYGGGRIAESQLFCRIVEARGRDEGLNLEAVNVSAPAWSPQNWWRYIQRHGLHEADIVVLVLPECDLDRAFANMNRAGHRQSAPSLRIGSFLLKLQAQFGWNDPTDWPTVQESKAANLNAVIRLREQCKSLQKKILAVLVPSRVPQPPNEALWSPFLDQSPGALDLRHELQDPAFFSDGSHLSVEGNAFMAEKIFDRIRALVALPN